MINKKVYNERLTEEIVRGSFRKFGYYDNEDLLVEEQVSTIPRINKLLQNASKKGSGVGRPEFIISSKENNEFVCVIECKADVTKHQSLTLNKFSEYAVDGARLYADYLSKEADVLYIGVSGQNEDELRVSHYLKLKGESNDTEIFKDCGLQNFNAYLQQYKKSRFRVDYENLLKYVSGLNETLHSKKIPEKERAILFSGILIALEDDEFRNGYKSRKDPSRLANFMIESIVEKLSNSNVPQERQNGLKIVYDSLRTHQSLIADGYLPELVKEVDEKVRSFIISNEYHDIISHCYVEFLKYANDDGSLGIVLTPSHITDLFCELASLTYDSVVFDNCCGTGGFLVAAMGKLVKKAKVGIKGKTIEEKIEQIKSKQILGIEYQNHIFNLCVSNMIIHGDGKSNIWQGDCFKRSEEVKPFGPDVALLNPPYSDVSGIDELVFIENALSTLVKGGIAIAIIPMRCALYTKGKGLEIKRRILTHHTLDAVMSMPNELFYPKGVVSCVMIFRAHVPHDPDLKSWFGYWKNDGHVKVKRRGRVDTNEEWESIKSRWVSSYKNREIIVGESVSQSVQADDEWCAEAYMETDYSKLTRSDFEKELKKFTLFNLMLDINNDVNLHGVDDEA